MQKLILTLLLIGFIGSTLLACGSSLGGPEPKVVSMSSRSDIGWDYSVWVDTTIQNNGDDGWVNVECIWSGDNYAVKEKRIYMQANGRKELSFQIWEATALGSGQSSVRAWAD